jgi:hypothetical protein
MSLEASRALIGRGDFNGAVSLLSDVLDEDPLLEGAFDLRAQCYISLRQLSAAMQDLDRLLEISEDEGARRDWIGRKRECMKLLAEQHEKDQGVGNTSSTTAENKEKREQQAPVDPAHVKQVQEMIPFLTLQRVDVRATAFQILVGVCGNETLQPVLSREVGALQGMLLGIINYTNNNADGKYGRGSVCELAATCVVNLTASEWGAKALVSQNAVHTICKVLQVCVCVCVVCVNVCSWCIVHIANSDQYICMRGCLPGNFYCLFYFILLAHSTCEGAPRPN